jgi:uncharacterized protein
MPSLKQRVGMDITLVGIGLVVGLIVGLTGVGGGSLMTPILIGFLQVPPTIAVGTDLLFAGITKGVGSALHAKLQQVVWPIVAWLTGSSLLAAGLTLFWMRGHDSQVLFAPIRSVLGVALLLTAVAVLFRDRLLDWAAQRPSFERYQALKTCVLGALIGVLVTLSSVGAGAVGVTALLLIYPNLPLPRVVGTDLAYAVPLTLLAGAGHAALGHVDWSLLAALLVGSIPGIALGASLSAAAPERLLRSLLSACLTFAGLKVLI